MDDNDLNVLYEDNHLLAVVKPAGLLVQGDRSGDATLLDSARLYLKEKYGKPGNVYVGLVHRLDRPVSGVVLLARTSKAAGRLSRQFREGTVAKFYLAVVAGDLGAQAGDDVAADSRDAETELVSHLAHKGDRHGVTGAAAEPFPGSREARLAYTVLGRRQDRTLVRIRLLTGRRHQIRAQFSLLGHPVLGDVKYGAPDRLSDRSLALHASRLVVGHPVGGRQMFFTSPPAPDWPWPYPVDWQRSLAADDLVDEERT